MSYSRWKRMAERTKEADRPVMFSRRMYLKITITNCTQDHLENVELCKANLVRIRIRDSH